MTEKKDINRKAKENQLDFLYDLHLQGAPIGEDNEALLRKFDYIKDVEIVRPTKKDNSKKEDWRIHNDPKVTGGQSEVDKIFDIVKEVDAPQESVLTEESYRKLVEEKGSILFSGLMLDIKRSDWMPRSINDHTKDFIEWIDSISFGGFSNRGNYRKFNLYCQQAYQWIAENDSLSNYSDHDDRENYKDKEIERCSENTLYFLNKYLQLKESTLVAGMRQYVATKAHEIMIYLFDCGYSYYLGKPRQIAATSTLGACAMAKTVFRRNHFIKFITENDTKGQEIFEDKIKYPFAELPWWMRDESRNDSGTKFALGTKENKGDRAGTNSNILVAPPTPTAISGGSPSIALVDEAGNIPILTKIIEDARPTSFWMNPTTRQMERKRQIVVWGTGGDMEKGGKSFEREFMTALKNWRERKFASGIIPIFFDWTTRPGITQEIYDSEKEVYNSKEGPDAEQSRITFRQQYPTTVEDMFITSAATLLSQEYIQNALDRILKTKAILKPKYGYFEPIFGDEEQPEGSDVPFNIIGANFIPLSNGDPIVSVTIFQDPKPHWLHRYYQGTDPLASDSGTSNMASSIWDRYYNTISAVVNYRTPNYREVFMQCMLLGIYYDTERQFGVPELLETNIGKAYQEYKTNKGRYDTFVFNTELPPALQVQSGSNMIGIDNRGHRNRMIINNMTEMFHGFGDKIYIEDIFIQAKTFVSSLTAKGNETWGPADKKYYKDDILFSSTFAYICATQCFPLQQPFNTEEDKKKSMRVVSTLTRDKNLNLVRTYKTVRS